MVNSLPADNLLGPDPYEPFYCARGNIESTVTAQQLESLLRPDLGHLLRR